MHRSEFKYWSNVKILLFQEFSPNARKYYIISSISPLIITDLKFIIICSIIIIKNIINKFYINTIMCLIMNDFFISFHLYNSYIYKKIPGKAILNFAFDRSMYDIYLLMLVRFLNEKFILRILAIFNCYPNALFFNI